MQAIPAFLNAGINLGNSLDAFEAGKTGLETETCWENPVVTKAMIQMYADAGFDTLRVPVTWDVHMGSAPDWTIDPAWMARVHQVVDWGLEAGMAVILNAHHEFAWVRPELSQLTDFLPRYVRLWRQIAASFRDYGDKLLLQGSNEPNLMGGENCAWGSGTRSIRAGINVLNHTFVRTIRESGGNNAKRWLCIPNLAARPLPECMRDMIAPKDQHVIYTIHCYSPDRFIFSRKTPYDTAFFDAKAQDEVRAMFEDIKRWALPHGMPIMITEWGAVAKRLPHTNIWNDGDRLKFAEYFLTCAREMDIPCVWWDNNYLGRRDEYFGLFDRETLTCHCPEIVRACVKGSRQGMAR